jgi:succinate-acetate transporter protein
LIGRNFVAQGEKAVNEFIEQLSYQNSKQGKTNSFLDSSKANASPLGCLNTCLSSQGLPTVLLGIIGTGCGIVCGATLGIGCAACLGFVFGGYAGIIDICVRRCF